MKKQCSPVFFAEPETEDPTYAHRGEQTLNWLERSTVPRARECRRFLNEHLSRLPTHCQERFSTELRKRSRWRSTFFELILVRILQELGASIDVEEAAPDGKRPDLWARFDDELVVVEATAPIVDGAIGKEARNRNPLLEFIESNTPHGWWVGVSRLPHIDPQDSQKLFKKEVLKMLCIGPPENDKDRRELVKELSNGTIHLHLVAARKGSGGIGWEPPLATFNNTEQRICHSVKAKRRQVRGVESPVILAINTSGIISKLEDFDKALFGRVYEVYGPNFSLDDIEFRADGLFTRGDGEPTYAGVLAFLETGFGSCSAPVLFHHPRFSGTLPSALLQLEQHTYVSSAKRVEITPAQVTDLIDRLNLVKV